MTEDSTPTKPERPSSIVFTYHDPGRTFEGDPYEAAGKSVKQTANVVKLLRRSLTDTHIQVRNAWMQRNLDNGLEPEAENWTGSPEHKVIITLVRGTDLFIKKLTHLHRAATYDPTKKGDQ